MNDKKIVSFNISYLPTIGIPTVIACAVFILIVFHEELDCFHEELDWWVITIFATTCLIMICATIDAIITDYYLTFDYKGFIITERNRISKNEQIKSYKWSEIKELYFRGLYDKFGSAEMMVVYKKGGYDAVQCGRILSRRKKFIKLAQYYSGREGIVKTRHRKRKLYEKDW